eukprot:11285-Prymnesium_polylepis.1
MEMGTFDATSLMSEFPIRGSLSVRRYVFQASWCPSTSRPSTDRRARLVYLSHTCARSHLGHPHKDLGRSVDLEHFRPPARRTWCRQWYRSRSARVHGLPRPGGLADGR